MNGTTWLALAALASSATSPLLLVVVTSRARRAETRETWSREDAVAARLEESNAAVAARAAAVEADTRSRLTQIHTLVNSELTEAQRRERDATAAQLATMTELLELRRRGGEEPSADIVALMADLADRVTVLNAGLAAKTTQTQIADAARAADTRGPAGPGAHRRDPRGGPPGGA